MRVVVDTNVLLSIAIGSRLLRPIQDAWRIGRFSLLVSEPLLAEFIDVANRPHLRRYFVDALPIDWLAGFREVGEAIEVAEPYPEFEDPDDGFLLAMVRNGSAKLLVTGDRALLRLERFEGAEIISPREFVERLHTEGTA